MRDFKKKKYLFVDELKRIKISGLVMSIAAVIIIFMIGAVSKLIYSHSAEGYFNKQAVKTVTNISNQIAYEVSSQVNSWYAELEYADSDLLSQGDSENLYADADELDLRLKTLGKAKHSEFNDIGLILENGEIYFSNDNRIDISDRDYLSVFMNDSSKECAESINDGVYAGNLLFAVKTNEKERYIDGNRVIGVAGLVSRDRAVKILETDVFGKNGMYAVLSDYDGNIIVDTQTDWKIKGNIFDAYKKYSDTKELNEMENNFRNGVSGIIKMEYENSSFFAYYLPINLNGDSVETNNKSIAGWRIIVMTRESAITGIISELFNESRVFLYIVLSIFAMVLVIACIVEMRNKIAECRLASLDSVTGVLNNKRFCRDANVLLERNGENYMLMAFNISQFRIINNELGHDRGDTVLKTIGEILQNNIDKDELVTHSFADRYLLLVKKRNEEPTETAEYFRKLLSDAEYPDDVDIKFNAGVYVIRPNERDISRAMDCARFAQSKAKEKGGMGIVVYSQEMFDKQKEEYILERRAAEAIEKGYFTVYYQMKMDIQNNTWCGAEALVRWIDPVLGFISPGEFIPLFERNGFVKILDKYVFDRVCSDIEKLVKNGEKCYPISVNVSKKHLENKNFFAEYESILSKYDIPHHLIEFEITENMIVENEELLKKFIDRVHSLGCTCSLDDFGSGYSSFNMVKEFAFDTIKLDREFFYGSNGFDDSSRTIVESLIDLSHKLGKSVISEGIENEEQVAFLKNSKCDAIQGFYFSRPAPFEESLKKAK